MRKQINFTHLASTIASTVFCSCGLSRPWAVSTLLVTCENPQPSEIIHEPKKGKFQASQKLILTSEFLNYLKKKKKQRGQQQQFISKSLSVPTIKSVEKKIMFSPFFVNQLPQKRDRETKILKKFKPSLIS